MSIENLIYDSKSCACLMAVGIIDRDYFGPQVNWSLEYIYFLEA